MISLSDFPGWDSLLWQPISRPSSPDLLSLGESLWPDRIDSHLPRPLSSSVTTQASSALRASDKRWRRVEDRSVGAINWGKRGRERRGDIQTLPTIYCSTTNAAPRLPWSIKISPLWQGHLTGLILLVLPNRQKYATLVAGDNFAVPNTVRRMLSAASVHNG